MLENPQFYSGLLLVLEVFAGTLVLSLPLGLAVALVSRSRFAPLRWLMVAFITVLRGTPLLLQLIFVYFGLPVLAQMLGITGGIAQKLLVLDQLPAVLLAFTLNYAAYFAEIYRGGFESIDKGQYEAARTLGFNRSTTLRRIILPQVIKRILPPVSNEIITLVKDTSLVYAIGAVDILRVAQIEMNKTASLAPLAWSALVYLIIVIALTYLLHLAEKRLAYYR